MLKYLLYLSIVPALISCGGSVKEDGKHPTTSVALENAERIIDTNNIQLIDLDKKLLNDTISANLNVVDCGINYMPSHTKQSKEPVTNELKAWEAIKELYPDFAKRIKCWTEYHGYYVFSIGYNDPKTDCMFWHILYVKKDAKEFRYFWPHT